jgi:hypothetical protein
MLRPMLARLILLLVAVPAIALAEVDPLLPADGPVFVPQPVKPKPIADTAPQPALESRIAPPPADPAACRMTCAQANYFCAASDPGGDMCGQTWGQCVNNCNSPGLDPAAAPAP